ncbi:UNVERIFIED_CONTAM: hypothetical protein GTU68_047090 [Idotea baltica]|nr:hypothetical protein [Idotea baltica]
MSLITDVKERAKETKAEDGKQVLALLKERMHTELEGKDRSLRIDDGKTNVWLVVGVNGVGKTTTIGKLGKRLVAEGHRPLMAAGDTFRAAAAEQLNTWAERSGSEYVRGNEGGDPSSDPSDPVKVAANAIEEARNTGRDVVIVDTAGRLAIDEALMEEVRQISEVTSPDYTFLVVDAMTGQDAVNVAEAFHEKLELDGVILTKLDGDARGGAALSVKEVVGRPIAFAATGEKLEDFDLFHPDRMASRILGMGDMLTLIEKAEETFEAEEAEEAAARLLDGQFTLDDFLDQMQQLKKMGPLTNLVGMLPGLPKEIRDVEIDDREVGRIEAIIKSMTMAERSDPEIIDTSRRARIAAGSGTNPTQVAGLITQFSRDAQDDEALRGYGP